MGTKHRTGHNRYLSSVNKHLVGRTRYENEWDNIEHATYHKKFFRDNLVWDDELSQYSSKYNDQGWKTHRKTQWREKKVHNPNRKAWHGRKRKPVARYNYLYRLRKRLKDDPKGYFCEKYNVRVFGSSCPFSDSQLQEINYVSKGRPVDIAVDAQYNGKSHYNELLDFVQRGRCVTLSWEEVLNRLEGKKPPVKYWSSLSVKIW